VLSQATRELEHACINLVEDQEVVLRCQQLPCPPPLHPSAQRHAAALPAADGYLLPAVVRPATHQAPLGYTAFSLAIAPVLAVRHVPNRADAVNSCTRDGTASRSSLCPLLFALAPAGGWTATSTDTLVRALSNSACLDQLEVALSQGVLALGACISQLLTVQQTERLAEERADPASQLALLDNQQGLGPAGAGPAAAAAVPHQQQQQQQQQHESGAPNNEYDHLPQAQAAAGANAGRRVASAAAAQSLEDQTGGGVPCVRRLAVLSAAARGVAQLSWDVVNDVLLQASKRPRQERKARHAPQAGVYPDWKR
jgi:hypothetical protein